MDEEAFERAFLTVFAFWAFFGIVLNGILFTSHNAPFKRKVLRYSGIGGTVLLIVVLLLARAPLPLYLLTIPLILLVPVVGRGAMQFCDACGATLLHLLWWEERPIRCTDCRAPLPPP